jgi:TP901 family phage tail tape measure protein
MAKERLIIEVTESGTRRVQRRLAGVGKSAGGALSQVSALKSALVGVGAGLVLGSAIRTLASFGQEMSTVAAITGATGREFDALTARAKELGATTRFTATEAATGMVNLSRAGFSAAESMETVGDVLLLAQAGAVDLGTAASITTATLRGFGLATSEAGHVVDVLAVAANSANTDIVQLGEGMKLVAPVAKGLGVSLEETTAILGSLADAGLQASLSGTGLRKILATLADPSGEARREFEKLNVSMDDLKVSADTGGLLGVFQRLKDAGVGTAEAFRIFGIRGAPAFNVIKEGIGPSGELTEKLKGLDGEAREIAAVMDDNLNGALLKVKSAIESVVLAFGTVRGGFLQKTFEQLATAIRFFGENVEIVQGILISFGVIAIPTVISGLKALFILINTHPIGVLIIALGAAIGWLVAFKDELKVTEDGLTNVGHVFQVVWADIQSVVTTAVNAVRGALEALGIEFEGIPISIEGGFIGAVKTVSLAIDSIIAIFSGLKEFVFKAFENIPDTIGFLFFEMGRTVLKALQFLVDNFTLGINKLIVAVEEKLNTLQIIAGGAGTVNLGRVAVGDIKVPENPFKEQGDTLGAAFLEGFEAAGTPATDYVDTLIPRATILRKKQELAELAELTKVRTGPVQGPAVGPAGIEDPFSLDGGVLGGDEVGADRFRMQQVAEEANTAADALKNTNDAAFELGSYMEGQFNQGLNDAIRNIADLSSGVSGALTGAFNSATDALADFALSGFQNIEDLKAAFSDLFAQLAKDILNLILKMLLLKALQGALGGTGLGDIIGGAATGGKQAGGPVSAGVPVIVGEKRPELFVPPSQGNIMKDTSMLGQPAQVTVVNVSKEDEVPSAMNTPQGHEVFMNFLTQKRDQIKRVLS